MAKKFDDEAETPGLAWDTELVRRFGAAARDVRGKRSARWLAERTAELGYPISPTVIAKLDSGHRGSTLQLAEVLVIATALEVSPIQLLYPEMPGGSVEVVPGIKVTGLGAFSWFTGMHPLPLLAGERTDMRSITQDAGVWHRNNLPARLTRELGDVVREGSEEFRRAEGARADNQDGVAEFYEARAAEKFKRRDQILRQMYDMGMKVPDSAAARFREEDAGTAET